MQRHLLEALRPAIPKDWTVLVCADRGLYAKWRFERIVSLGWHPLLRINAQGWYRQAGQTTYPDKGTSLEFTVCEARTLFRPHPQPLSHSVGEGFRGTRRCALQPFPLSRLRERGTKGVRAIQRTCWFTLALGKIAPASKTSCRTVVPLPAG